MTVPLLAITPGLHGSGNAWLDTAAIVVWSDDRTSVNQIRAQRLNWNGAREWGRARPARRTDGRAAIRTRDHSAGGRLVAHRLDR